MAGYNPYKKNINDGFSGANTENRAFFSKLLRNISTLGGSGYDNMVVKNSVAYNINENPRGNGTGYYGMYDMFASKATAMMAAEQPVAYLQQGYADKRRILREYSVKDEIRDFITTISDKSIVYQKEKGFCSIADLPEKYPSYIKNKLKDVFDNIYDKFKFSDSISAWRLFKRFIIDGFLAFEIVFDDQGKNIVGFNEMDVAKLVYAIDPMTGIKVWVLEPEDPQYKKILLDSQVIYLSYSSSDDMTETSYVEPLIRPYNQLQLIQYTKLNFNLMNAMLYREFTVPVKDMSNSDAEAEMGNMIADYNDEVIWDDYMGTVTINAQKRIPFSKDIWWPEKSSGKPSMEIKQPQGANLNEDTMLNWFYNVLKRASRLPFTRFDKTNGGGVVFGVGNDITNDDLDFDNFINRLRAIFREILLKPIYIQMCLHFPQLIQDISFKKYLNLEFFGNSQSETGRYLSNLEARANIASTLLSNLTKADGTPALHIKYIMKNIMEFTDDQLAENDKYFLEDEQGAGSPTGGGGGSVGNSSGGGLDMGGPDMGSGTDVTPDLGPDITDNPDLGNDTGAQPPEATDDTTVEPE